MMRVLTLSIAFVALSATAWTATSTFNVDGENWAVVTYNNVANVPFNVTPNDFGLATWFAAGGNPAGHVSAVDPDNGWTYFQAPEKFHGDYSDAYGTNATWDLRIDGANVLQYVQAPTLILKGNGMAIGYFGSITVVGGSQWQSIVIPLTETDWKHDSSVGPAVSLANFQSVLADLDTLEIKAEYVSGAARKAIDNVNVVPEPATILALSAGALALIRRKRSKN